MLPRCQGAISDTPEAPRGCFGCSWGAQGQFRTLPRHLGAVSDAPEVPTDHFGRSQDWNGPFRKCSRRPQPFPILPRCHQVDLDAPLAPTCRFKFFQGHPGSFPSFLTLTRHIQRYPGTFIITDALTTILRIPEHSRGTFRVAVAPTMMCKLF